MREIIFDTETTGLDNKLDRVIEIGGVELENHFPTGRTLHLFINPGDRKVHPDALAVHGITDEFLKDYPPFADVVERILGFFGDARWVAHNATFDMGFINFELKRSGRPSIVRCFSHSRQPRGRTTMVGVFSPTLYSLPFSSVKHNSASPLPGTRYSVLL